MHVLNSVKDINWRRNEINSLFSKGMWVLLMDVL